MVIVLLVFINKGAFEIPRNTLSNNEIIKTIYTTIALVILCAKYMSYLANHWTYVLLGYQIIFETINMPV